MNAAPFVLIDTAGLRESDDAIEAIGVVPRRRCLGVGRCRGVWLGEEKSTPSGGLLVAAKSDLDADGPAFRCPSWSGEGHRSAEV